MNVKMVLNVSTANMNINLQIRRISFCDKKKHVRASIEVLSLHYLLEQRSATFFCTGTDNTLAFSGHIWFVANSCFTPQSLKNVKTVLISSGTVQK